MKLSKVLIKLARISPKEYSAIILKRNKILLKKLMMLKPYVYAGTFIKDIPIEVMRKVRAYSTIGCPHCGSSCNNCLWSTAIGGQLLMPCIRMNYFTDDDQLVRTNNSVRVIYWNKSELIEIGRFEFYK